MKQTEVIELRDLGWGSVLTYAATFNKHAFVSLLLQTEIDLSCKDDDEWTALDCAKWNTSRESAQLIEDQ